MNSIKLKIFVFAINAINKIVNTFQEYCFKYVFDTSFVSSDVEYSLAFPYSFMSIC